MKPTFRKSMIWLHTYIGLLSGWLLFVIFLTGTLSYYNAEISHWISANKFSVNSVAVDKLTKDKQVELLQQGLANLTQHSKQADSWQIQLPDERGTVFSVEYRLGRGSTRTYLTPQSQETFQLQETNGGNFFRTFHYTLSLRDWGGRYFACIAAMSMLLAIFTGIYTHRRFFKDFFTIRTENWQKRLKDLHAVFGVITIPFSFVICFSALLIYISMYIPFVIQHHFDNYRNLDQQVSSRYPVLVETGTKTKQINIQPLLPQLEAHWGKDYQLNRLVIKAPTDNSARAIFYLKTENNLSNKVDSLAFTLATGELIEMPEERLARNIRRIFYGLHEANFAKPSLRVLLFSLGIIATFVIASGMVLWLQKRRQKQQKNIYSGVEKLNLGMLYGLPLAVAGYFIGSRLPFSLPIALKEFEVIAFFNVWLFSVVFCLMFNEKITKLAMLVLNSLFFVAILLLDVFSSQGYFMQALANQNVAYLTVSGLLFITAGYFSYATLIFWRETRHE